MIEWFAKNHVAANLLMIGIILMGLFAVRNDIALELMPDFNLGSIVITTVLPGGNPKSIEATITTRVEETISDLEGIKNITSRSAEGVSSVIAEIEPGYVEQNILNDIKVRVDALNTLPADAERPIINIAEIPIQVIGMAVYSDSLNYDELYQVASDVRESLLMVPGITRVGELQAPYREIHIEVTPQTLKRFNLSIEQIGQAIRRNAVDLSAGNLRTSNGDILVRANGQAYSAHAFRQVPIINIGDSVIYLGEIAKVTDGYELLDVETRYNSQPAITFDVYRIGKQSTIEVSNQVHKFIVQQRQLLPQTVKLGHYWDTATVVEDRLSVMLSSAVQGGILVILLLSLLLRPAVAFWVGLGIPVCFLGGIALMPVLGLSLNMLTMFAFILVLGIVVDDAIVTGENIYRHTRNGMLPDKAAVFGTKEVAVPVTLGVLTTMVAFSPLFFVEGVMATFAKQIPMIVIPVLFFSLIESKLILPAHMSGMLPRTEQQIHGIGRWQQKFSRGFENAVISIYRPFLTVCIRNKTVTLFCVVAVFIVVMSFAFNGWLKSSFFPAIDDDAIFIELTMPATTGYETIKAHIADIVAQTEALKEKYSDAESGNSLIKYIVSVTGVGSSASGQPMLSSNRGMVIIEVAAAEHRPKEFSIRKLSDELRNNIGEIAGAEKMTISSSFVNFGKPISVALYGKDFAKMSARINDIRDYLKSYPGVFDIQDNYSSGKEEVQLEIKPVAKSLGITLADISSQVRQAVYGYEAQRIQRRHDEIKVMVRYPPEYRSSLADVINLPIKVATGEIDAGNQSLPLADAVQLIPGKSPTAIYHDNHKRTVTVSADIDTANNDLNIIRADLVNFLDELLRFDPGISYDLDGQAKAQKEASQSLLLGLVSVLIVIYALMAIPFKSFWQPLIVMSVIPLSFVGAIVGHVIMGERLSILSFMGVLALTGIVVNDSLVLVDYINSERQRSQNVLTAVLTAGEVRFRPVLLTSLTTFVGLLPLMSSKSLHAKALIPMAISLGFGIVFATIITLIIVPVNYMIYIKLTEKRKS